MPWNGFKPLNLSIASLKNEPPYSGFKLTQNVLSTRCWNIRHINGKNIKYKESSTSSYRLVVKECSINLQLVAKSLHPQRMGLQVLEWCHYIHLYSPPSYWQSLSFLPAEVRQKKYEIVKSQSNQSMIAKQKEPSIYIYIKFLRVVFTSNRKKCNQITG